MPRPGAVWTLVVLLALAAGVPACRNQASEQPAPPGGRRVEIDRIAARLEKSDDTERLAVSARFRAQGSDELTCYLFIVARTQRGSARRWAIWPLENPGLAISAGGHFHAAHPTSGYVLSLVGSWEQVEATLPRNVGDPPFDTVVFYVVGPDGVVLLSHPYAL